MFGSLSFNEIFFIMVLALLIFGPKRLPQIGRTLGRAIGEFRRASSDFKRSMEVEMSLDDERRSEEETRQSAPRLEAARDNVSRGESGPQGTPPEGEAATEPEGAASPPDDAARRAGTDAAPGEESRRRE